MPLNKTSTGNTQAATLRSVPNAISEPRRSMMKIAIRPQGASITGPSKRMKKIKDESANTAHVITLRAEKPSLSVKASRAQ